MAQLNEVVKAAATGLAVAGGVVAGYALQKRDTKVLINRVFNRYPKEADNFVKEVSENYSDVMSLVRELFLQYVDGLRPEEKMVVLEAIKSKEQFSKLLKEDTNVMQNFIAFVKKQIGTEQVAKLIAVLGGANIEAPAPATEAGTPAVEASAENNKVAGKAAKK